MQINFSYSSNRSGDIRATAYETTALSAPVDTKDIAGPFLPSKSSFLTVPNPVAHVVRLHALSGGVQGALLHEFEYDPTYNNAEIIGPYQVVIGGDISLNGVFIATAPVAGEKDINIPALAGKDVAYVERRGTGNLTTPGEYANKPTGGITLTGSYTDDEAVVHDAVFNDGEIFFVQAPVNITTATPAALSVVQLFGDTVLITANTTLNGSHERKLMIIESASASLTITLPALSTMATGSFIGFCTPGGVGKQHSILTAGADLIEYWNGTTNTRNAMYIGVNEFFLILKTTISSVNKFLILFPNGHFDCVGERTWSDRVLPNTWIEDGTSYVAADYPRVVAYLATLPSNYKTADLTLWASGATVRGETTFPYKGLWGFDGTTIIVPDTRGNAKRALKAGTDTTRSVNVPGGYQHHIIGGHQHESPIGTLPPPGLFGQGAVNRLKGNYNGSPATGKPDLTSSPVSIVGDPIGGPETIMRNNGYFPLVKI